MSKENKSDKACCKDTAEGKLVKATELPIHGNPYPPKDVIIDDTPSALQLKISSFLESISPYTTPVIGAFERTSDVLSIGSSHLQTTLQGLVGNQNSIRNAAIISTAGLLGFGLARRRGVIKRLFYGSTLAVGTTAILYPVEVGEKSQLLWYIAKNKLPGLAHHHYQKFFNPEKASEQASESPSEKAE